MSITLKQVLDLVGKLDDSPGNENPRERFRRYFKENVREVGSVRDYIEECLRSSGNQYSRSLQDSVNYLGTFLGFEVTYGRYKGTQGEIGFDGLWSSPTDTILVVEVKTSETYSIKTSTLVGYIDQLVSEETIPDWDHALGLYVIGRPDAEIKQLENTIIAEKRIHQLRIISVEYLLSLAEMMQEYDVSHEDVISIIRPSGPKIDPVVDVMTRLVSQRPEDSINVQTSGEEVSGTVSYWLTSAKSEDDWSADEIVETLVGQEQIYAITDRTPGRKLIKEGDRICFYAAAKGIVAHGTVSEKPHKKHHPKVRRPEIYQWVIKLDNTQVYTSNPIVLDAEIRGRLDAFQGRDLNKPWSWFVQATRKITKEDYELLTSQQQVYNE